MSLRTRLRDLTDRDHWILILLSVLVMGVFLGVNLAYNRSDLAYGPGVFSAPLDDTFIHLQYGRQIGEGELFRYNDGDAVSSGGSSFLYAFVLGVAHFAGLDGGSLLGFAIVFGASTFVISVLLGLEIGRKLVGNRAGLWSGLLIATNGALAWGATSGMEVGLLTVLLLGTLLAFLRESASGRFWITPSLAALAALTRPEGWLFAAAITGSVVFLILRRSGGDGEGRSIRRLAALPYVLLPLVAGALPQVFYWIAAGNSAQNGILAKSLLYQPFLGPVELVDAASENLAEMIQSLLVGISPERYLFPGALLFCLLGAVYLVIQDTRHRVFAVGFGSALVLSLASLATLNTWGWHHFRYLLPFFPLILIMSTVGFRSLADAADRRWLLDALGVFALLFSLVSLPIWAATAGGNALQVREQQVSIGYWLRDNIPQGARVAVNDAGAIRYYGGHPTVDLVGLTTNGLALPYRNGVGSLYEALERIPERERPDYFAIYPEWFSGLETAGVMGEEIARFTLTSRPDVAPVVGSDEVVMYRADWSLARSGASFRGEGEVRDTIDVADIQSEEQHDYQARTPLVGLAPSNLLLRQEYPDGDVVTDAGRQVPGSEEFVVSGLSPGRPLTVVMRTTSAPFDLRVRADGRYAGRWVFQSTASGWLDVSYTIPAEYVNSESLRIELLPSKDAPLVPHAPYYYWFAQ